MHWDTQYGQWTWTHSEDMDMNMQQGHEHTAWTCTLKCSMYLSMLHVLVDATYPCPCSMPMSPCPYCVSQYMLRVQVNCPYWSCVSVSKLHVHVYDSCCPCMSVSLLQFCMSMYNCTCCLSESMLSVHVPDAYPCPC